MNVIDGVRESPWDTLAFGLPCYELERASPVLLGWAARHHGHYTVRVHPLDDKRALHQYGFYYADTLIEPACTPERLRTQRDAGAAVEPGVDPDDVAEMCVGSFRYGRFHRDPALSREQADRRYVNWLKQLATEGELLGLLHQGELAGFIAIKDDAFVLHAMAKEFRGRGLARSLWSAACCYCFEKGATRLRSSISAANLAALNLYASLGFHFSKAADIYHRMTEREGA